MPPELRFLFPDLDEGLYAQGAPFAKHRPHNGLALLHLTFAIKQLSQDSLSLTGLGGLVVVVAVVVAVAEVVSDWSGILLDKGVGRTSDSINILRSA